MPNRIIKETIRTSRDVNNLTDFQFRTWVYLITYVDDYGRGSADPELLKGFLFPRRKGVTEQQISKALADLANMGMITLYQTDGEPFLCFPNWDKHQRIRTKVSKFPAPSPSPEVLTESNLRQSAASCGELPQTAAECGEVRLESNPIQSESESEYESNPNSPPYVPPSGGKRDVFAEFAGENQTLLAALRDYEAMRNKIRKPMTERARELAVLNLQKLGNSTEDRVAIVNQSVQNSWTGLFPLDAPSNRGGASRQKKYMTSAEYAEVPPDPMALRAIQKMMGGGEG